eukprot:jgi/Mesvir1/13423/Mv16501-RA.1
MPFSPSRRRKRGQNSSAASLLDRRTLDDDSPPRRSRDSSGNDVVDEHSPSVHHFLRFTGEEAPPIPPTFINADKATAAFRVNAWEVGARPVTAPEHLSKKRDDAHPTHISSYAQPPRSEGLRSRAVHRGGVSRRSHGPLHYSPEKKRRRAGPVCGLRCLISLLTVLILVAAGACWWHGQEAVAHLLETASDRDVVVGDPSTYPHFSLVVAVMSSASNADARAAARATWAGGGTAVSLGRGHLLQGLSHWARGERVLVVFLVSRMVAHREQLAVEAESAAHGDMLLVDVAEGHASANGHKLLLFFKWLDAAPFTFSFVAKVNDNVYARPDTLVSQLRPMPRALLFMGQLVGRPHATSSKGLSGDSLYGDEAEGTPQVTAYPREGGTSQPAGSPGFPPGDSFAAGAPAAASSPYEASVAGGIADVGARSGGVGGKRRGAGHVCEGLSAPYLHGSLYVLSADLVHWLAASTLPLRLFASEDATLGFLVSVVLPSEYWVDIPAPFRVRGCPALYAANRHDGDEASWWGWPWHWWGTSHSHSLPHQGVNQLAVDPEIAIQNGTMGVGRDITENRYGIASGPASTDGIPPEPGGGGGCYDGWGGDGVHWGRWDKHDEGGGGKGQAASSGHEGDERGMAREGGGLAVGMAGKDGGGARPPAYASSVADVDFNTASDSEDEPQARQESAGSEVGALPADSSENGSITQVDEPEEDLDPETGLPRGLLPGDADASSAEEGDRGTAGTGTISAWQYIAALWRTSPLQRAKGWVRALGGAWRGMGAGARRARARRSNALLPAATHPSKSAPLVSIICTSLGRVRGHPQLYSMFSSQTYPHKQLLLLDDAAAPSHFFQTLGDPRVVYMHAPGAKSLGQKRDMLVQRPDLGDVLANWDADAFYSPHYLATMMAHMRSSGAALVKLASWYIFDLSHNMLAYADANATFRYNLAVRHPSQPGYCGWSYFSQAERERQLLGHGASYVYLRRLHRTARYAGRDVGDDAAFVRDVMRQGYAVHALVDTQGLMLSVIDSNEKGPGALIKYALPRFMLKALFGQSGVNFVESRITR